MVAEAGERAKGEAAGEEGETTKGEVALDTMP